MQKASDLILKYLKRTPWLLRVRFMNVYSECAVDS